MGRAALRRRDRGVPRLRHLRRRRLAVLRGVGARRRRATRRCSPGSARCRRSSASPTSSSPPPAGTAHPRPDRTTACAGCCSSGSRRCARPYVAGDADQRGRPAGDPRPGHGLVEGPLALIEVGASAGLCLFPDRYDYAWPPLGGLRGSGGTAPDRRAPPARCRCRAAHPEVAWRGGVDLNPLDVADPDAMAWLENLVWPEQDERRERLRTAVEVARTRSARAAARRPVRPPARPARRGRPARHARGVPLGGDRLPRGARPAPVPRPDDRPGRGRPLPVDQQRGAPRPARRDAATARSRRAGS